MLNWELQGYAKGCTALATATKAVDVKEITAKFVVVTDKAGRVGTPAESERLKGSLKNTAGVISFERVGHWHSYEDPRTTATAVKMALE